MASLSHMLPLVKQDEHKSLQNLLLTNTGEVNVRTTSNDLI